jgi:PAS domain S-box-containing protein
MPVPLRVMMVEDSENDALLLLHELRRGGYAPGFERVETPEAMRAALDREPWDIILADYSLPHFSAPEALALVRERKLDLPFIVVSGKIGEETAVVLMRAGAHDYLMKDNLARLVPAVKRELRDAEVRRERKRAEEALRAARGRLHHLLTASSAVVYSCEPSGSYSTTFISENVKDLLGYEARQFTEDPGFWARNIHPEDAPGIFAGLPRILELGHHQHEYRFRHQDGTYRWMHDAMRLVRDAAGRPVEIVGTWVDITDRKQAEEALRASEAKYRSLVEHLPAITYVAALDEASTTLYVSPQIEAMIGFSPAEYAANPDTWRQRLHPDDRERVMAELLRSRARGAPLSAEYRMIARDGHVVWFRDEAALVRDPAGGPLFLQGVMVDITERKRLQEEILRITEAERQRFGRELHDGLGQQLVGMSFLSDALANRLAAKSLPEAADARAIAEVAREGIEMARSAARGLCPVVGGGGGLASALGELASSTQRACQASCTFERGRPVSLQDDIKASHLYRIAQEAVTNALKHAKADAIHISLATRKGRLTLTVTDNGVGVSDEALVATKGMGLRAMRHRAELIGATLDVRRGARGGTAVTCALPASAPEDHPGTGPRAELP